MSDRFSSRPPLHTTAKPFFVALVTLFLLFFAVIGAVIHFLTQKQNELAQQSTTQMIGSVVIDLKEDLQMFAYDYALWTPALEHILANDLDWVWDNMASTIDGGGFDLFSILRQDADHVGWIDDTMRMVRTDLFSPEQIRDLRRAKSTTSFNRPATFFFRLGGDLFVLSVIHVQPWPSVDDPPSARAYPLVVFGKRIGPTVADRISQDFLVDGLTVDFTPPQGEARHYTPLLDGDGELAGVLSWPMPRPGTMILRQWMMAAIMLAVAVIAAAVLIGRYIVSMAVALRDATLRAQDADRAKTALLANVSHELRTPMNGVLGAAQLLESANVPDQDRELVQIIEKSAQDQIELIEDLLQVSGIDAGSVVAKSEPVDVTSLLDSAVAPLRMTAEQKGLRLSVEAGDLPVIASDPKLLRQCVTNLLSNAVKFTAEGGVDLTARWSNGPNGTGTLTICVADTGIGIPRDMHDTVFERFSQVDDRIERDYGGTGLGLAITRSLVDVLGGAITLDSRPGAGSRFTIRIPAPLRETGGGTLKGAA